jgi:rhodanese-related sulfurtransferase
VCFLFGKNFVEYEYMQIKVEDLKVILDKGLDEEEILIDVREPEEFAAGHIPGAVNVPMSDISKRVDDFRHYHKIYVNCFSGGRSGAVCAAFDNLALPGTVNILGGFSDWQAAGYEVEK